MLVYLLIYISIFIYNYLDFMLLNKNSCFLSILQFIRILKLLNYKNYIFNVLLFTTFIIYVFWENVIIIYNILQIYI